MSGRGQGVRVGGKEPSARLPQLAVPESWTVELASAADRFKVEPAELRRIGLRNYLDSIKNADGDDSACLPSSNALD